LRVRVSPSPSEPVPLRNSDKFSRFTLNKRVEIRVLLYSYIGSTLDFQSGKVGFNSPIEHNAGVKGNGIPLILKISGLVVRSHSSALRRSGVMVSQHTANVSIPQKVCRFEPCLLRLKERSIK
jgi:hypothetical protein